MLLYSNACSASSTVMICFSRSCPISPGSVKAICNFSSWIRHTGQLNDDQIRLLLKQKAEAAGHFVFLLQQIQPSNSFSKDALLCSSNIMPSTSCLPNSFIKMPGFNPRSEASSNKRMSKVVLPLPRKPLNTSTGILNNNTLR